jgi:epoxyqueuosine reductase
LPRVSKCPGTQEYAPRAAGGAAPGAPVKTPRYGPYKIPSRASLRRYTVSFMNNADLNTLATRIKQWGTALGFQQVGIAGTALPADEARLIEWLERGWYGDMDYMRRHGRRRSRPQELAPGTVRVISVRMDYLPETSRDARAVLEDPALGFVSRYALGRDYHKVMRGRLRKLAQRIAKEVGSCGYRVCVDSAPVLEKALARDAGLGWIGKHTNLLNRHAGSWFFLGELLTDLPLPVDSAPRNHCGSCQACIDVCPTRAIVGPYRLDARRCISYLTIEHHGSIPVEFRKAIGNRIYGCDDCQLVCPWNRYAKLSAEPDFAARHGLDGAALTALFAWTEKEFLTRTEGSAIRRIGYERWLRNVSIALGNAPRSAAVVGALTARRHHSSVLVREHVSWALARQAL